LVILPRSFQYSALESPDSWEKNAYQNLGRYVHEPFNYFERVRDEVDYPIYPLLTDFQETDVFPTCFIDDPHYNASGAHLAAARIYKRLKSAGDLD
jgi:hypothetical protein